jgi:DNA-binding NarL/FixJ family response regulator
MKVANKLRVFIAHGEPLLQMGLESALGCCDDFDVRSSGIEHGSFDIAITDLDLGMELARRANGSCSNVLVVTSVDSELAIRGALEAGIRGYLPQSSTPASLARAIRCVGRGGTAIDPQFLTRALDSLNGDKLTERETEVLRLIVVGRSNKSVAAQLGITVGTAKCHVRQLMAKLNARSRTEAANIARCRGLVPPDTFRQHH